MRLTLVLGFLIGMTAPAFAQQAQTPAPNQPAPDTLKIEQPTGDAPSSPTAGVGAAPQGQGVQEAPKPRVTKNGDWYVGCQDITVDGQTVEACEMQQIIEESRSGQAFIRISVLYPRGSAKPVLRIFTPLGVRLQRGLVMQIDQRKPIALPFAVCVSKPPACIVDGVMENSVVSAMKRGSAGTLKLTFGPKQVVDAPFSLAGFTKSINAIAPR